MASLGGRMFEFRAVFPQDFTPRLCGFRKIINVFQALAKKEFLLFGQIVFGTYRMFVGSRKLIAK